MRTGSHFRLPGAARQPFPSQKIWQSGKRKSVYLKGMPIVCLTDIHEAQARLHGITVRTRLIEFDGDARVPHVSRSSREVGTFASNPDRRLFLKPENQQPIGAF